MNLPDLTEAESAAGSCALCSQAAKYSCAGCGTSAYCSQPHQKDDWAAHKDNCKAYKVLRNDAVGRYAVTSRSLDAGELILSETPFVVGPKPHTSPLCLGCYTPVDCTTLCSRCGWALCSTACETASSHADAECPIFTAAKLPFQPFDDWTAISPQYECITPLRLLLARESNPARWEAEVKSMESHNEKRKGTDAWMVEQVNTVEFLRKACKLGERFTEEDIHTACGILEVNSFEIRCPNGALVHGLYPQTAILSHSCVPNTRHSVVGVDDHRLELRTSVKVAKGEEVFATYVHTLEPTMVRRERLAATKQFDCACRRCKDPTELGTHLGTLKCGKCDNGLVLSTEPLNADAAWKCTHCEFTTRGSAVRKVYSVIQDEIDALGYSEASAETIEAYEGIFRKYRSVLHPRHSCMTSLRHTLATLYGRVEGYSLADLPDILLGRKVDLCRGLMEVADVLEPGVTRLRGMTLYELHAPLLLMARSQYRFGELDDAGLKGKMEEVVGCLEEAVGILKVEGQGSAEGMLVRMGEEALVQLKESIQSLGKS